MRKNPDGSITLSRRNLLSFLHKLDKPGSARTLVGGTDRCGDSIVIIRAENDDEHYAGSQAGPMTPDTEAFIRQPQLA
jgi:hypothetical protein